MPLCVRHREGWCVVSKQKTLTRKEREGLVDVRTLCKWYVHNHFGIGKRQPTCTACLGIIAKRKTAARKAKAAYPQPAPAKRKRVVVGYRARTLNKKGEVLQYTDPFPTRAAARKYLKKHYDHFLSGGYAAITTVQVMGWR